MCDDRMGNRLWQTRNLTVLETVRNTIVGVPMGEAERNCLILAAEHLARTGELREELLPVLWEPLGVKRDDYAEVLTMLCMAGMLLLSENTHLGRRWLMPMRIPDSPLMDAHESWSEAVENRVNSDVLRVTIALGSAYPPGVLERLLVACQGLGQYKRVWRNGSHSASNRNFLSGVQSGAPISLTSESRSS